MGRTGGKREWGVMNAHLSFSRNPLKGWAMSMYKTPRRKSATKSEPDLVAFTVARPLPVHAKLDVI